MNCVCREGKVVEIKLSLVNGQSIELNYEKWFEVLWLKWSNYKTLFPLTFYNLQVVKENFSEKFVRCGSCVQCRGETSGDTKNTKLGLLIILSFLNNIIAYLVGFRYVPLRFLILVMTSKSLKRKNPRSFRVAWPEGIETSSKDKKSRSLETKSLIPSIPFSSSRSVASRCPFSRASRSLQLRWTRISCTSLRALEQPA